MKVSQVIALARSNELNNLSANAFTDDRIIGMLNLGIIELSKRFTLATKVEGIRTSPYTHIYSLRNTDVIGIIDIYDSKGKSLIVQPSLDSVDYDYKLISNNSFLLHRTQDYTSNIKYVEGIDNEALEEMQTIAPPDFQLMVVYSAVADLIETVEDNLPIPDMFIDALLAYLGYKAHSTAGTNGQGEDKNTWGRFEYCCGLISGSSYMSHAAIVGNSVQSKGFV